MISFDKSGFSRRSFLKSAAIGSTALFAPAILRAQGTRMRKNLMSPDAAGDLQSYADAVNAMLNLPPDDPRNWYRIAFIHFLDCPHGNWWFTSWHRGYLGYFEELCREMSGNPDFMLPYWDWTADPFVPPALFGTGNPLDPVNYAPASGNAGYIPDFATFENQLRTPMQAMWNAMTPAQATEQAKRMNPSFDYFWSDPNNGAMAAFQARPHARFLTAANPDLDVNAQPQVAMARILADLAPVDFAGTGVTFENPVTNSHQGFGGFSPLSGTHNIVHMSVGGSFVPVSRSYAPPYGLMSQNLSPIDPIFFLHHCNIDRLWDVWTRKQLAKGRPTGPTGELLTSYKPEPYLFFVDAQGQQVTDRTTAWDYFEIGDFDYGYAPGSGEELATAPGDLLSQRRDISMTETAALQPESGALSASLSPTSELVATVQQPSERSVEFAQVSFVPPKEAMGKVFRLVVSSAGASLDLSPEGADIAGSFTFFGQPHHSEQPVTFTIPIDQFLDQLAEKGALTEGQPVSFSLVAGGDEAALVAEVPTAGELKSVLVQAVTSS